jgi:large subunit ribosomal protein L4
MAGAEVGTMELSDVLFGGEVNGTVLHAAVRAYLLNQRQGTQSTLTRSEVSGGGRKPWRQKGTGRARQGSTRSPQWTHGGIALGPKPRTYRTDLNKKTKRLALISALTDKVNNGKLIIVDDIKLDSYKTKVMADMFKALGAERKPLVVLPEVDSFIVKSCANIPGAKTCLYNTINVYDILNADTFITTVAAVKMLEEVYA